MCSPPFHNKEEQEQDSSAPCLSVAAAVAAAAFFGQAGAVNCVRMRRHLTSKDFKGSVFVEFASQEEADKVGGWARGCWAVGGGWQVRSRARGSGCLAG